MGSTIDAAGKIGDSDWIRNNGFNDDREYSGYYDELSEPEDVDVIYVRQNVGAYLGVGTYIMPTLWTKDPSGRRQGLREHGQHQHLHSDCH